jgi:hypothetical protein
MTKVALFLEHEARLKREIIKRGLGPWALALTPRDCDRCGSGANSSLTQIRALSQPQGLPDLDAGERVEECAGRCTAASAGSCR